MLGNIDFLDIAVETDIGIAEDHGVTITEVRATATILKEWYDHDTKFGFSDELIHDLRRHFPRGWRDRVIWAYWNWIDERQQRAARAGGPEPRFGVRR